ncbi:hypothetical protein [Isoptericola sediminis]|uniref:hypothetical protein n=1 Tax=Isoptericola sediminis TaxID=2733572 RepID=UPI0031B5C681
MISTWSGPHRVWTTSPDAVVLPDPDDDPEEPERPEPDDPELPFEDPDPFEVSVDPEPVDPPPESVVPLLVDPELLVDPDVVPVAACTTDVEVLSASGSVEVR